MMPANIDDLIAKVLAGEASPDEQTELANWEQQSPDNHAYVKESRQLFAAIEQSLDNEPVNTDAAWKKVEHKLDKKESRIIQLFERSTTLRVAAGLLLFALLSVLMFQLFDKNNQELVVSAGSKMVRKNLPDGSTVIVNKNSEIRFTKKGKERRVELKGNAFFEVVHNQEEPFFVQAGQLLIKDIGTAFDVQTSPDGNLIMVDVIEGEVELTAENKPAMRVHAGEGAMYDMRKHEFSMRIASQPVSTLPKRSFNFEAASLREVISQINQAYGSDLRLGNEELGDCELSVQFIEEDLEVMISVIAETLDLEVQRKGEKVIFKGEGCKK